MTPDREAVNALIAYAKSAPGGKWPLPREVPILTAINTWVALREGDKDTLKRVASWRDHRREYRVDPLPDRIADAWAHFLFGEDPRVLAANTADDSLLEDLLERDFPSELERGAGMCVSEGEIWARIYSDAKIAPRPLLEWVSRLNVLPFWVGPRLAAAAVITELADPKGDRNVIFRLFEVHAPGILSNHLFCGGPEKIGDEVDLSTHPATLELEVEWPHGLDGMLLLRVPNRLRRRRDIGISDYAGILDNLLDLNEAAAIGAHNMRLTARKRAIISASVARTTGPRNDLELGPEESPQGLGPPQPKFDAAEEIFVEDALDGELGREGKDPFRILEYSFDAGALIDWKRDLVETALTRVGLTPQYVGVTGDTTDGYAISGTALRLRLIPTDNTGRGKGRYWDDALPRILQTMQALDALPDTTGGFGRPWTDPLDPPSVERRPGLPVDDIEEAQRHATLRSNGLESLETALAELHPDWTQAERDDERDRLKAETPPRPAGSLFAAGGMGGS